MGMSPRRSSSGYAVAATDTGHQGNTGAFAIGHPEKLIDWGNRAIHETAVAAKAVVAAHYDGAPKYSYYNGCSTGGRQGWVSAEYYPNDFDGLAIGDPANPMTRLQANSIWINLALNKDDASFIPQAKWSMIHQAVMNQCDALDGAKDGIIENPMACNFPVDSLLCKTALPPIASPRRRLWPSRRFSPDRRTRVRVSSFTRAIRWGRR